MKLQTASCRSLIRLEPVYKFLFLANVAIVPVGVLLLAAPDGGVVKVLVSTYLPSEVINL